MKEQFVRRKVNVRAIPNVGVISLVDAGEATTTEHILFYTEIGNVRDGVTAMASITSTAAAGSWKTAPTIDIPDRLDLPAPMAAASFEAFDQIDKASEKRQRAVMTAAAHVEYQSARPLHAHQGAHDHTRCVKNGITGAPQMDGAVRATEDIFSSGLSNAHRYLGQGLDYSAGVIQGRAVRAAEEVDGLGARRRFQRLPAAVPLHCAHTRPKQPDPSLDRHRPGNPYTLLLGYPVQERSHEADEEKVLVLFALCSRISRFDWRSQGRRGGSRLRYHARWRYHDSILG